MSSDYLDEGIIEKNNLFVSTVALVDRKLEKIPERETQRASTNQCKLKLKVNEHMKLFHR